MGHSVKLLIAEREDDLLEGLTFLFDAEGYAVTQATTLAAATARVERESFDFVLTCSFTSLPAGTRLAAANLPQALREAAYPTPVGLMTAWPVAEDEVQRAGFACLLRKPFDLNDALTCVADAVHAPLTPLQERHALVARRFLDALGAQAWDAAVACCSPDVVYHPPTTQAATVSPVAGQTAVRRYLEEMAQLFPHYHCEEVHFVALPKPQHLGVRCTIVWEAQGPARMSEGVVYVFDEQERIQHIRLPLSPNRPPTSQAATG